MKSSKARREDRFLNEIVETLKDVPTRRLRIVRDIVGALAEPRVAEGIDSRRKKIASKSLLDTPFCGMWAGRRDIANGRSFAKSLRQRVERRGDRS